MSALAALVAALSPFAPAQSPVEAYFTERSYRPGDRATLVVRAPGRRATVQVFHVGPGASPTGVPVNDPLVVRAARTVRLRIRYWPSGVYLARIRASSGATGFAPLVLRPRRLGARRVAVVMPTNTWQAYNFRDENGDGVGDTWYASEEIDSVSFRRAFAGNGLPPRFRAYDVGFLRWLSRTGRSADFLSDDDLDRLSSGRRLAALYDLIVFPGHEEYVTARVYDLIRRYRDAGGNLAFLSANNFFYRVERLGERLVRAGRWRDLGRPEAALVGVQYLDWNHRIFPAAPFTVVGAGAAPWLFPGTGLRNGSRFGRFGIEIDARSAASPPGVRILARIVDVFGPGMTAEMAYYQTASGAKVFAAGALNFGSAALVPPVPTLLANLWERLSRP